MAHSSLERLRQVRDIQVSWLSYELRPARATPPSPEEERQTAAYKRKVDANWHNVQAMAQTYGITMNARNRNTQSRLALEAAKFAEAAGYMDAYAGALFHAHFTAGRDLSAVGVLVELAAEVGMDGVALRHALENHTFQERVERELALAFTYKLSGVPAFIMGRKYLVVGAQPVETLIDVVDKCLA